VNRPPALTARIFVGLVVLTLGVLWTLDNLGMLDASRIIYWWPVVALGWGVIYLFGLGVRRNVNLGSFWTIIGAISLLNTLGVIHVTIFALWPVFLVVMGASMVFRGWRGTGWIKGAADSGSRPNVTVFLGGAEHKVVGQDLRSADVTAIMGAMSVDFRSSRLAEREVKVDVFALWGGIDLVVPEGWRVEGRVTPILGAFQDLTKTPADPNAPKLIVAGEVVMGGIEVMNEERQRQYFPRVKVDPETGESTGVRIMPGGIVISGVRTRKGPRARRGVYGVVIGPGGVHVKSVNVGPSAETPAPETGDPRSPEAPKDRD